MSPLSADLLGLAAVFVLVLANAFFVASEFALVSVRRTRIKELVDQGNRAAGWVQRATSNLDRAIAATQLGITLASLGLGWIGEPALSHLLQPVIELFPGAYAAEISHALSAGLAFAVITFLHVVIGELAPKSIALQAPERTALAVARPTVWTSWIFYPMILLLNGAGTIVLRAIGIKPASGHQLVHSVEELKMLVAASAEGGVVEDSEEEMLRAVFDFGDTLVRQVMVPRTEVVAVASDTPLGDIVRVAGEHPFSKLPVYEGSLDHVIGIVHLKDLLKDWPLVEDDLRTARELMREAIYVPETARVASLLARFRRRRQHMAIVLDEYGGTAGVVTLADLAEEIVGEVSDTFDEPEIQPRDDGSALIDGLTPIEEVNEHFGMTLDDPHYDTLAGLVLGRLGRMAHVGDVVVVDGAELRVEAMDGLRIARLSLSRPPHTGSPSRPS